MGRAVDSRSLGADNYGVTGVGVHPKPPQKGQMTPTRVRLDRELSAWLYPSPPRLTPPKN